MQLAKFIFSKHSLIIAWDFVDAIQQDSGPSRTTDKHVAICWGSDQNDPSELKN